MHAAQYFSMFLCLLAALHCQLLLQFIQLATNFSLTERLSFTFCLPCHFYSSLHEIQPMGHRSVSFISRLPSRRMVPYSERGCRSTSLASVSSYGFAMDFLFDLDALLYISKPLSSPWEGAGSWQCQLLTSCGFFLVWLIVPDLRSLKHK